MGVYALDILLQHQRFLGVLLAWRIVDIQRENKQSMAQHDAPRLSGRGFADSKSHSKQLSGLPDEGLAAHTEDASLAGMRKLQPNMITVQTMRLPPLATRTSQVGTSQRLSEQDCRWQLAARVAQHGSAHRGDTTALRPWRYSYRI